MTIADTVVRIVEVVLALVAVVLAIYMYIIKWIVIYTCKCMGRSCADTSSPRTQPSRHDTQRQTSNQRQPRGASALSTGDIAILNVETLVQILSQRQSEIHSLPLQPPPDHPPARRNAPTRPRITELLEQGHAMQSATMPCMPTCVICQDRQSDCCLDCGHLLCSVCAWEVRERDNVCPVCRELFTDIRMIYPDNSIVNNREGASQSQKPYCPTGICPGLECDSCLSCGHMLCYVCACQLKEMGSKCLVCQQPFTDIRRIYY